MGNVQNDFNEYRAKMNEVIVSKNNLAMKRLWNLDTNTYEDGALSKKIKEMPGLVASMVLRWLYKISSRQVLRVGSNNRGSVRDFCGGKYCRWNHRYTSYKAGR